MVLLWGKPSITITSVTPASGEGTSTKLTVPDIVSGSTQLSTETGQEHTADIEGGGYEARRYDKNTFTFEFACRFAQNRVMPFSDVSTDGKIKGTYKVVVAGEDTGSPTMTINEATVRYEDNMTAEDGAQRHYYFESLVPAGGGKQIVWDAGNGSASGQ